MTYEDGAVEVVDPDVKLTSNNVAIGGTTTITYPQELSDISFTASPTGIVTITKNTDGTATVKGVAAGSASISASWSATTTYNAGTNKVLGTVTVAKGAPTVTLGSSSIRVGGETTISYPNDLSGITFTSSNTGVATVSADGTVAGIAQGTATITASWDETSNYTAGSKTFEVTVKAASTTDGEWVKTELSDIKSDEDFLIVDTNTGSAIPSAFAGSAPKIVTVTLSSDKQTATIPSGTTTSLAWNVTGDASGYTFHSAEKAAYVLFYTGAGTGGLRVSDQATNADVSSFIQTDSKNSLRGVASGGGRYIVCYTDKNEWRVYANNQSATSLAYYKKVEAETVAAPTINTNEATKTVTITVPTGCTVHYTTDGTTPTKDSPTYTAPFTVDTTTIVRAIAVDNATGNTSRVETKTLYVRVAPDFKLDPTTISVNGEALITYPQDLSDISFTSSNGAVATVTNNNNGTATVRGVAGGTATITATWSQTDVYTAGSNQTVGTITVNKIDPVITIAATDIKVGATTTITYPKELTDISFNSSNTGVATVTKNSDGTVTVTGVSAGSAVITATWSTTAAYNAGSGKTIGTVAVTEAPKVDPTFHFSATTIEEGGTVTITYPAELAIKVETSDNSIATVVSASEGTITIHAEAPGTVNIIATWDESSTYNAGSAKNIGSITVTQSLEGDWIKTDISEIAAGDQFLIVDTNNKYALENATGSQPDGVSVTLSDDLSTATIPDGTDAKTLTWNVTGNATDGYVFYPAGQTDNYLYIDGSEKAADCVKIGETTSDAYKLFTYVQNFTYTTKSGNSTTYTGLYNENSKRYLCFLLSQKDWRGYVDQNITSNVVAFYRKGGTPTVQVTPPFINAENDKVTITAEDGCTIYYTTDGSTPDPATSTKYTDAFTVAANTTVKAIAVDADGNQSTVSVLSVTYTVTPPTITADETNYTVTLSADEGCTIYYTTNGADVVSGGKLSGSAIYYNGPFTYNHAITVKAVAVDANGNISDVTSQMLSYHGEVTPPYYEEFSESLGNFTVTTKADGDTNDAPRWIILDKSTEADIAQYGEARKFAYVAGHNNSTGKDCLGETTMTSPIINLTDQYEKVTMSFTHAGAHFTDVDAAKDKCTVWINEVAADGTASTPTQITIPEWFSPSYSYPRHTSGDIDLSDYIGKKVQISFKFENHETGSSKYGTWNVIKFNVTAQRPGESAQEEVVTLGDNGFYTYVTKNPINWNQTLSNNTEDKTVNVHAYKITEFTNKQATLVEFGYHARNDASEDQTPAGTPIILQGTAGDNKLIVYDDKDQVPSVKGNLLHAGQPTTPSPTQKLYVLKLKSKATANDEMDHYAWYRMRTDETVPTTKAYLNGDEMSATSTTKTDVAKGVYTSFEDIQRAQQDIVTGITDVKSDDRGRREDNVFYNLQGMRVAHPTHGIYIFNGRKVIIK